jgi:chromosome segregation protein
MRLKRLELQGFKSFLDRTVLTFQPGITGVVGPNGCGKSNIVDAIQWVMGEQSAKHLRGDSMTDVIFNGSDSKAATSMAEVSLILDRQGVALAPQFAAFDKSDEIAITRRVYRDGTSEYCINKTQCRLKDIHELFMDTGVGKRAYSIIEQGQIDRMISVKPEERRGLFEEVAGITKYKAKRKEAEKKLEGTRQNLTRLQDIINELEKQIRSLKVQATRARKYKELKGELEAVDLYLLGRNAFRHAIQVEELSKKREELVNERSESDAAYSQFEANIIELDVKRIDQEKEVQQLGNRERDLSLVIQKLESQVVLLEERKKHLQEAVDRKNEEQQEISHSLETLKSEMAQEQTERDDLLQALEALERELAGFESSIREHNQNRSQYQNEKNSLENKKTGLVRRGLAIESQEQSLKAKQTDIKSSLDRLEQKVGELNLVLESQRSALLAADQKIDQVSDRVAQAEKEVTTLFSDCQESSSKLSSLEESLYRSREEFHTQRSRLQSLRELQNNLEGYSSSARDFLLALGEDRGTAIPLAEVISPEADIEESLESLLASDMNTILVQTTEEAERLTRLIAQRGLERVRIVAVSELNSQTSSLNLIPGTTPLIQKVRVEPQYNAVANWWFGNVYLANDLSCLFDLRKSHPELTFIASDGQTVGHRDRSLTSGKTPTRTGVFARRREIDELAIQCESLETELNRLTAERESLFQHLQNQEKLHTEMKDKLSVIHIEAVGFRKEREKLHFELTRLEKESESLRTEKERNHSLEKEVESQLADLSGEQQTIQTEMDVVTQELQRLLTSIEQAEKELETLGQLTNEKKVEKSRLAERRNGLEDKLNKIEMEVEDKGRNLERLLQSQKEDQVELETKGSEILQIQSEAEQSAREKDSLLVQLADIKAAFQDTCTNLTEIRLQKEELQKRREAVFSEIQDLEIRITHEQSSLDQLKSISNERYHCDPTPIDASVQIELEKLPLFTESMNLDWTQVNDDERRGLLEEHLKNMKEKIARYGEVNLTAIQEFDDIQKRYEFLTEQKADLEKSIQILEDAIKKIEETTKVRFTETFEAVNKKFTEIFPILFNGGKAELTLVYQEGSQEPGVDIMAQPPGKRLQSITLLSGGEKALTAVSLVLAIFARKPSPFCLLDEVDAPLDDANVSRFNTVVKKMAEKTQFIVITHNKKTMEIAEALYGVTMQRNGISKMASVALQ